MFIFSGHIFLAYLDPGSGSMVIQILIGLIAALTFTFKAWWGNLLSFFKRKKPKS